MQVAQCRTWVTSLHGCVHHRPVRDASADDLQPRFGLQKPVMTQRANAHILIGLQNAADEMAADFAGGSGNQDALHGSAPSQSVDHTARFKSQSAILVMNEADARQAT